RRLLGLLAERLFLFPRRLTGEPGDIPTGDDVLGVRIGDLMRIAWLQNRNTARIAFNLMLRVIAVIDLQDATARVLIHHLQLLALRLCGDFLAINHDPEIFLFFFFIEIDEPLPAEECLRAVIERRERLGLEPIRRLRAAATAFFPAACRPGWWFHYVVADAMLFEVRVAWVAWLRRNEHGTERGSTFL